LVSYPIPGNEIERLATLGDYRILDTDFDSRFDNLVAIAAAHFATPIALVSLVDADRQWFKAKVGLDIRETPRSSAFCTYAITCPATVTVIEDATRDPRFQHNPLVVGAPHIRFYAGAPILAEDGAALGTVSVIDTVPRRFEQADRQMLARLADTARSLLELHRRDSLLREAAHHDPLTGLLNRRGLDIALEQAMGAALAGETCGLLWVDLDRFKQVNDTYGHDIGDGMLKETARRLQTSVRQGDQVARIGGDEFAVLLAHPVNRTVLELVATRILRQCAAPVMIHDQSIGLNVSIGAAKAPRDAVLPGDLMRAADRAVYEAKRAGRGQLAITGDRVPAGLLTAADGDGAQGYSAPGAELALAIERNELFLEWQSSHDLTTNAVIGYEALVRWRHPRFGVVAPNSFVPLAEACGLSGRLDAWVLFRACEEAACGPADVRYSINLSAQWLANGNVLPLVRTALERSGLDPDRLILEITESTAIGSVESAQAHMRQLRQLGIRMALDDFGTGYSSLSYLQQYPFDLLKIDRSFVTGLGSDPRGDRLLEGVINLARLLGIAVVAEGVETPQHALRLRLAGCDMGQGYYWARPCAAPWTMVQRRIA
jgi:diguanylate cyclase (GGDEF)-like protein